MSPRHKRGVRVQIEFTKRGGKVARFWADAPEGWDETQASRRGWAETAAQKYHPGATNAHVVGRE